MDLNSKISGDAQLLKAMAALPRAVHNRAIRPALRAGAAVVRRNAKSNAQRVTSDSPRSFGDLSKSLVVRSLKMRRSTMRVAVTISPQKIGGINNERIGLYGSVLEFGKENQVPRPWLRPSIGQSRTAAGSVINSIARQNLDAAVAAAKLGRY